MISFALSNTFFSGAAFSPSAFMQIPMTTAVNTTARILLFVLNAEVMLFGTALTRDNLTCSEMKDINDTYLYLLYKNGASKEELDEFIVDMCNSYPIMKFNDQSLVMQNIIYLEQKILNRIFPMPYQARLYLQKSDEIYELYGLILILNSVLRGYLNEICLPDITQKLIGNYKMEIGICLGFNSICLITLMILLHYFVAMRLVVVNEKLNLLLKFLE